LPDAGEDRRRWYTSAEWSCGDVRDIVGHAAQVIAGLKIDHGSTASHSGGVSAGGSSTGWASRCSFTTALAPNLTVLILGWSVLEGVGAALTLPAIVALVAGNVPPEGRPRAYGLIMAAGAIAVAVGPLIGGIATTYFSWRWVFVGEVVVVLVILVLARGIQDAPVEEHPDLDLVGAALSAAGVHLARSTNVIVILVDEIAATV
jgi:MFS family permease